LRARKRSDQPCLASREAAVSSIPAPFPLLLPAAARNLRSSTLATAPPPAQPHPRLRAAHRRSPHPPHGRPNVASPRLHPRSCETLQDVMPAGRPGRRGSVLASADVAGRPLRLQFMPGFPHSTSVQGQIFLAKNQAVGKDL
jgi:hypothetical protein